MAGGENVVFEALGAEPLRRIEALRIWLTTSGIELVARGQFMALIARRITQVEPNPAEVSRNAEALTGAVLRQAPFIDPQELDENFVQAVNRDFGVFRVEVLIALGILDERFGLMDEAREEFRNLIPN